MYHGLTLQQSKKALRMIEEIAKVKKSRRGTMQYESNPFVGQAVANTKQGVRKITNKDNNRMMIVSENTGEVLAPAGFWQAQEVDKTQFVKLYVNGVKAFRDLSGAGTKVFEVLYITVQENIGKDVIYMSFPEIDQQMTPMGEATFYRGMKELIDKGFIAESLTQGKYFLNPDYMWNGDRLAFVKEFRRAPTKSKPAAPIDTKTIDMFQQIEGGEPQE
jgi:hypothetical protein